MLMAKLFNFKREKMSVDILLKETEALPLPMDVLHKMAGKGNACRVITYDDIAKAHKLSDVLNETHPYAIVLVMDHKKGGSVGHYIAIWLRDKKVFFFDAYAHRVKALLDLMGNSDALIRLVHAADCTLVPNKKQFQEYGDKISTCGRHCCVRLRLAEWEHQKYARFMRSSLLNPDQIVTMLTMTYASGSDHHDALGGAELDEVFSRFTT
jgi:hypothetical protein